MREAWKRRSLTEFESVKQLLIPTARAFGYIHLLIKRGANWYFNKGALRVEIAVGGALNGYGVWLWWSDGSWRNAAAIGTQTHHLGYGYNLAGQCWWNFYRQASRSMGYDSAADYQALPTRTRTYLSGVDLYLGKTCLSQLFTEQQHGTKGFAYNDRCN